MSALELSSVLDPVAVWQGDLGVDPRADVPYHAADVAPRDVPLHDDQTLHVLPTDGVWSALEANVGQLGEGYGASGGHVHTGRFDDRSGRPELVRISHGQVEGSLSLQHLRDDLAVERHVDRVGQRHRRDTETGHRGSVGVDAELRHIRLRLDLEVHETRHVLDGCPDRLRDSP